MQAEYCFGVEGMDEEKLKDFDQGETLLIDEPLVGQITLDELLSELRIPWQIIYFAKKRTDHRIGGQSV